MPLGNRAGKWQNGNRVGGSRVVTQASYPRSPHTAGSQVPDYLSCCRSPDSTGKDLNEGLRAHLEQCLTLQVGGTQDGTLQYGSCQHGISKAGGEKSWVMSLAKPPSASSGLKSHSPTSPAFCRPQRAAPVVKAFQSVPTTA